MSYYTHIKESQKLQYGGKTAAERLRTSELAKQVAYTKANWRKKMADETAAIGDKLSLQQIPGAGKYIPDWLDAGAGIGNMASAIGRAPLMAQKSDSNMAYLKAVGAPLVTGATFGLGSKAKAVGAAVPSSVVAAAETGLRTAGTSLQRKAGLMSSYEILGLGAGRGLTTAGASSAAKAIGVGAGENAISVIGNRGLQTAAGSFAKKGATDLARFGGNGLSKARQPLSIMYDNKQFSTLASIVAAAGIDTVARDYYGGDLNKAKQAVIAEKKSGASGNPALPINPGMKSWQDAAGKKAWTDAAAKRPVIITPGMKSWEDAKIKQEAGAFIDKIPDYVDPANRKAVVDAAKKEAGGQDTPEVARIKRIQRTLGVEVDGIEGKETKRALEAMKETQRSLGFTGKDVDGIRGVKTNAAIKAGRAKEIASYRENTPLPGLTPAVTTRTMIDPDPNPIRITRPERTNKEMRQEKRAYRKAIRNAPDEFDIKRRGGIFYCLSK
jgi:peptidoglycan hydrolase-like protein with peptidoglycan-binding domain